MKLTKVRITNFQCLHDSEEFDIGDVTCLVGKNESGKTAILKALHKFNSFNSQDSFVQTDFPISKKSSFASNTTVVEATFSLEKEDIISIQNFIGCECLDSSNPTLTLSKDYENHMSVVRYNFDINAESVINHIANTTKIKPKAGLKDEIKLATDLLSKLDKSKYPQFSDILQSMESSTLPDFICRSILFSRIPQFIYIHEYHQMRSSVELQSLVDRHSSGGLEDSDLPFVELLNLSNVSLVDLQNLAALQDVGDYRSEQEKLECTINNVLNKIFASWSQHDFYEMEFMFHRQRSPDPSRDTIELRIVVKDKRDLVRKPFESESHGFIWFFSFLLTHTNAVYKDGQGQKANNILLLEEPGLSLHGKGQRDLIDFFKDVISEQHQIIYTTHSPFMINSKDFSGVRIIENLNLESKYDSSPFYDRGTKVRNRIFHVGEGNLLPLQAALGYEIYQSLFIGPNTLIVEGASDLKYIQTLTHLLNQQNKVGLSLAWTIAPVGSFERVQPFVSLIGSNSDINVAVLVDHHACKENNIKRLRKLGVIDGSHVLTFKDYTHNTKCAEADIEDIFSPTSYLSLVNSMLETQIKLSDLTLKHERILCRLKDYFDKNPLPNNVKFSHSQVAFHLSENLDDLKFIISDADFNRFEKIFRQLNNLL